MCTHMAMKCPNCGGRHPAQDERCKAKGAAIAMARGGRAVTPRPRSPSPTPRMAGPQPPKTIETSGTQAQGIDAARDSSSSGPLSWVPGATKASAAADWSEDVMEITGEEPSGTTQPVAV